MNKKYVLDSLSAAHALAANVLKKADRVFYRQRRTMEDSYGMPEGLRVKNLSVDSHLSGCHDSLQERS